MLKLLEFVLSKPSKFFGTLSLILIIGIIVSDIISSICRTIIVTKAAKYIAQCDKKESTKEIEELLK